MIEQTPLREALNEQESMALPLAERAYRHLQREIITLRMKPGEVIYETELKKELGMGRTPIREALLRLSGDRLITIHPRRGTFVSDLNITDLGAVYEVRGSLEALAARLAAERIGDAECAELAEIRRELPALVAEADLEGLMALDQHLHRILYRLTKNDFFVETLEHYLNLSIRLARGAAERAGDPSLEWLVNAVLGFLPLLQGVEERRPDAAAAAARDHVAAAEKSLRQRV